MRQRLIDEKFMRKAIDLAKKGAGKTSPNPQVGAILVKNGKIISSGYHMKAGAMHAEVTAIKKAGKKAHGATLYCTLEACAHYGKTPPCVDTIIKSGVKRTVFAMKDPNPINYGRGIAKLRKAGITTECGILEKESQGLNRPFTKLMKKHLPYITIKMAQSLDGKIADMKGRSKWISSHPSRQLAHKLRAQNDAVMIGVNTLIKDDPILTSRIGGRVAKQPLKVVLDTKLRTPLGSRILENGKADGGILIAGGKGASSRKKKYLEMAGAKVVLLPQKNDRIDLKSLMRYLADINIGSILCEGGGELSASLLKEGLADEIFFFVSPQIIGGKTSPTSCGGLYSDIRKPARLKDVSIKRIGSDILMRGYL